MIQTFFIAGKRYFSIDDRNCFWSSVTIINDKVLYGYR